MKKGIIFFTSLILTIYALPLNAQTEPPIQMDINVMKQSDGVLVVQWRHIGGNVRYSMDVSGDSTFASFVPGLKNYTGQGLVVCGNDIAPTAWRFTRHFKDDLIFPAFRTDREGGIIQTNILAPPFTPKHKALFIRVNAFDSTTQAMTLVSTATRKVLQAEDKFFYTRANVTVVRSGTTSAYIPSYQLEAGKNYTVEVQRLGFSSININPPIIGSLCEYPIDGEGFPQRIGTISTKDTVFSLSNADRWHLVSVKEQGQTTATLFYALVPPLPPSLVQYVERVEQISVYSIAQQKKPSNTSEENLFYLSLHSSTSSTVNNLNIDSLILSMAQTGLPIDTVWFQETIGYCTLGNCGKAVSVPPGPPPSGYCLLIKMRSHDERINRFATWKRGYPTWSINDLATPRRYTFRQTMVSVQQKPGQQIHISPNPASDVINLRYSLQFSDAVEIELYDVLGRSLRKISLSRREAGTHEESFSIKDLPVGLLYARVVLTHSREPLGAVIPFYHLP